MSFFSLTSLAFLSIFLAGIPFAASINFTINNFESDSDVKISGNINVSGGPLQLAGGQPNVATAYYAHPIPLWCTATNENASFSTYFEFSVSFPGGGGGIAANTSPSGGFAFFLAPIDPINLSSVDSTPSDRLLAVEFNSFLANSTSNGTAAKNNDTIAARITYNATSKSLLVHVKDLKVSPNTNSSNISRSVTVDVRQVLPDKVRVGFSVTNGSGAVLQRIRRWNFTSDLEPERKKFTLKLWMVAPVVALIFALLLAVLTYYICRGRGSLRTKILYWAILSLQKGVTFVRRPLLWRRFLSGKVENSSLNLTESMDDEFSTGTGPRRFSYRELALATNNFSEKRKLGEGGFGGVFKGYLCRSGREVAVKKISSRSKQGRKEYASEVKIISRLRHRNLVQLLGWCHERGEFLLAYEFLPNGSLDAHLFGRKTPLPWSIRYKVAVGLAKALLYLHEEWEQCVVHRDIKPSNVMLDSGFNAKLGDFGLARLVDHQLGQHATGVAGTLGYLAPECFHTGKASKESDAYSFGMVALEIATGRRAVEHGKEAEEAVRLVDWVWGMNGKRRLMDAADRRLGSDFKVEEMERLMLVGLWCAHPDQGQRPSMREVIQALRFEGAVIPSLPRTIPVPVFPSLVPLTPGSDPSTAPTVTFGSFAAGR